LSFPLALVLKSIVSALKTSWRKKDRSIHYPAPRWSHLHHHRLVQLWIAILCLRRFFEICILGWTNELTRLETIPRAQHLRFFGNLTSHVLRTRLLRPPTLSRPLPGLAEVH